MRHALCMVFTLAAAGCGDNKFRPDASVRHDSGINPDAPSLPPPPALGVQIDRMGRPAISTALVAVLAANSPPKTAQKDAYNRASDPATWRTTPVRTGVTIERELAVNLAIFDALDRGLATPQGILTGCGNPLVTDGAQGPTFYQRAAALFTDDQLYVDTSRGTCGVYLALEIEQASAGRFIHQTCGGRMLTHDAVDVTYSVLAAGLSGLDPTNNFSPFIRDGMPMHTDVSATFPFLGPPNP